MIANSCGPAATIKYVFVTAILCVCVDIEFSVSCPKYCRGGDAFHAEKNAIEFSSVTHTMLPELSTAIFPVIGPIVTNWIAVSPWTAPLTSTLLDTFVIDPLLFL